METTYSYIHLDAGHDLNGNPRRGFLVFRDSKDGDNVDMSRPDSRLIRVGYVSEGYQGEAAMARVGVPMSPYGGTPLAVHLATIPTTPKYLRELAKECGL